MTFSHSFHSLKAEKGPISITFGHTHTGMIDTKSPPEISISERGRYVIRNLRVKIPKTSVFSYIGEDNLYI